MIRATTARALGQAHRESGTAAMPNGSTAARATSWARTMTGRAPYFCWSGTMMFAASPYSTVATRASALPRTVPPAPPAEDRLTRTTPANPTVRPRAWRGPGNLRRKSEANSAANRGMAPLIIPALDEARPTSWAIGNKRSGIAVHTKASSTTRGQSSRATGVRLRRMNPRASAPITIRATAITAGRNASRPMSIHRNEEPHIRATAESSPHSAGPNASGRVPWAVERTRPRAMDREGSRLGRFHQQNVAGGPSGYPAGDAGQVSPRAREPAVADHYDVGRPLSGCPYDAVGRFALGDMELLRLRGHRLGESSSQGRRPFRGCRPVRGQEDPPVRLQLLVVGGVGDQDVARRSLHHPAGNRAHQHPPVSEPPVPHHDHVGGLVPGQRDQRPGGLAAPEQGPRLCPRYVGTGVTERAGPDPFGRGRILSGLRVGVDDQQLGPELLGEPPGVTDRPPGGGGPVGPRDDPPIGGHGPNGQAQGIRPHFGQPSAYRAAASSRSTPAWFASDTSQARTSETSSVRCAGSSRRRALASSPTSSTRRRKVPSRPRRSSRSRYVRRIRSWNSARSTGWPPRGRDGGI